MHLLPDRRLDLIHAVPSDGQAVEVSLFTRYEDAGLGALVPHELTFSVDLDADDVDAAIAEAGAVVGGLVSMVSVAANAFVGPVEPFLAYERAYGLTRRHYWQRGAEPHTGPPGQTRRLREDSLFPFLQAVLTTHEADRLSGAISQYHVALSHWTTWGQPLAFAHLYMALETLGVAVEHTERAKLGLANKKDHALHLGIDQKNRDWRNQLYRCMRQDVLCEGDIETHNAAKLASDGFEHGYMPILEFRAAAQLHAAKLLGYVRRGIFRCLDLEATARDKLQAVRPLDVSDVWFEVRGELHGAVEDADALAEAGQPFPYADFQRSSRLGEPDLVDDLPRPAREAGGVTVR